MKKKSIIMTLNKMRDAYTCTSSSRKGYSSLSETISKIMLEICIYSYIMLPCTNILSRNTAETRKYPTTKSHNVGQVEDYYISTKLYSFSSYSSDVLMMWLSLYMLFNTVIPTFAHSIAEIFNTLQHIRWKFLATG